VSLLATGRILTGCINIFTDPISVEFPSLNVYEIVGTIPTKKSPGVPSLFVSLDGVNVIFPKASIVTVPTFGITTVPGLPGLTETVCPPTVNDVTLIGFPSKSVSFVKMLPVEVILFPLISFATNVNTSSAAKGASFTAATVMSNNPVSLPPFPSITV
jgi:hypothetical protein